MSQIATPRETIVFFNGSNIADTSPAMRVFGGQYGWSIQGTIGTGVKLQILGTDGVTWQDFGAVRTTNDVGNTPANSATPVLISGPIQMRAISTGSPAGLYVTLSRIP